MSTIDTTTKDGKTDIYADLNEAGVAKLGRLAREINGVEIAKIDLGDIDAPHLPAQIPVGLRFGSAPAIESVRRLADEWKLRPERKTGLPTFEASPERAA